MSRERVLSLFPQEIKSDSGIGMREVVSALAFFVCKKRTPPKQSRNMYDSDSILMDITDAYLSGRETRLAKKQAGPSGFNIGESARTLVLEFA